MKTASRSVLLVLLSLVAVVSAASPAMAGPVIDKATSALKTDAVYVDPGATDLLSEEQASQLRSKIASGSAPIVVAALPAEAVTEAGDVNKVVSTLGKALKDQGKSTTVAVLVKNPQGGTSFRAGSSVLPEGKATELADQAAAANKSSGPQAALSDFVAKVQSQGSAPAGNGSGGGAQPRSGPTSNGQVPTTSSSSGGFVKLILVLLFGLLCLVVPIVLIVMLVRRASRSSGGGGGGGMAPAGSDYLPPGPINRAGGGYNPTPGYGGGGRSFGGGVAAGAVGGGLLGAAGGYMLGEHMGREHEREDMQNEHGGDGGGYEQQQPNDGNWDNEGVGGGDWGGDSGGGGGDWGGDSGGGDWGGGGGDFGGGGTDF